jgi:protein-tyrosine phosphatase
VDEGLPGQRRVAHPISEARVLMGPSAKAILFICEGNTCRSPMAEAIARHMWGGLSAHIGSAGISARANGEMAIEARAALRALGYSPKPKHSARNVRSITFSEFSCVVTLDKKIRQVLTQEFLVPVLKIVQLHIKDPFKAVSSIEQVYIECARDIESGLQEIYPKVMALLGAS